MEGAINIQDFMQHLEANNLVIVPRILVENELNERDLQFARKKALAKKALTFKEIADARIWGNISAKSVKEYAKKYAKAGEIQKFPYGELERFKIMRSAVERLAKKRGQWID